jgi:PAS domain S-box-containing protein
MPAPGCIARRLRRSLILALLAVAPAAASAGSRPVPVLVIHSYHPAYTWTAHEQQGIEQGLRAAGVDAALQIEYLDAKWHPGAAVRARFEDLLRSKLARVKYPVVLVTDNAALEFAFEVRPRLFPEAAIVFCGVNGTPEAVVRGQGEVTGVMEAWDPAGTLYAISAMQPQVHSLLVLNDDTVSGRGSRAEVEAVRAEFEDRFDFEFIPPEPKEATLARVAALPDGWAVLLMGYSADSTGEVIDPAASGPLVARSSRVPVYTMEESRFSGGVVGGSLLSGIHQGELAAALASRILAGTPADALPVIRKPPGQLRFDFDALRRFQIPRAALPAGSVVLNAPTTYFQRHPVQVIGLGLFVLALMALSAGLGANVLFRRRAEEALRRSEENLRTTLDSIGDAVIATDASGAVTRMNPAAESMTGWGNGDALGRPIGEVFRLECADGLEPESAVDRVLREGRAVALPRSSTLVARDGARRDVADSAAPIRAAGGGLAGVVLVFRDVTSERALQDQLRQAQRMEVVGQLAGGVAHDFNNILTAILGAAQILSERLPVGSDDRDVAEELVGAALRATELTRQLLAFSRKGPMQMRPLQMHRVIEEAIRLLSRSLDKRIEIRRELAADPDTILGDPALLQSAILNLAVNGRDAMPDGGVLTFSTAVVSASPGERAPGGELLAITVRDTGSGMDEAVRLRLFEPYFTTKPAGKGTGLGLASVYGCVRSHKGQVQVESAPGRGSSFRILLPLLRGVAADGPMPGEEVLRGHGRVLVVDDEEIVRNALARMLDSLGYAVECFGDGEAALARYRMRHDDVDLVILDLVMPRLGGPEVFHLIRRIDPAARVVLASGYTQQEVTSELISAGALGFVHKPVRLEELSRQVHAALRTPRPAAVG